MKAQAVALFTSDYLLRSAAELGPHSASVVTACVGDYQVMSVLVRLHAFGTMLANGISKEMLTTSERPISLLIVLQAVG